MAKKTSSTTGSTPESRVESSTVTSPVSTSAKIPQSDQKTTVSKLADINMASLVEEVKSAAKPATVTVQSKSAMTTGVKEGNQPVAQAIKTTQTAAEQPKPSVAQPVKTGAESSRVEDKKPTQMDDGVKVAAQPAPVAKPVVPSVAVPDTIKSVAVPKSESAQKEAEAVSPKAESVVKREPVKAATAVVVETAKQPAMVAAVGQPSKQALPKSAGSGVSVSPEVIPVVTPESVAHKAFVSAPETVIPAEVQHIESSIPSMYVVHITPELAPVAKVGGLADVVFGLANEMEIRGNSVEIILPKYDCLRYDHIWGLCETYSDLWVPWYGGAIHCSVFFGFVHGRKCFFIEPHSGDNFFNRGCIYGFRDDVMRFAFFSRAAMEFLLKSGKNPDVIHCHDWQTALVPVFLFEVYKYLGMSHPRVCFTIHNFKHQGVTGGQILQATGLNRPEYYAHYDRLRDNDNPHGINLMKGGIVYSNFVTTVSPRHAFEAKDQGQGFGLEPTLHIHHVKFGGVVNGIDYNLWNPEIDPYIPATYSVEHIENKYANKRALRERLMIADNEKPIVAFVGRLDPQKGLELLRHAIYYTLQCHGQFVLLGSSPDGQINNFFWGLKHQLNDNPDVHIEIGFNEELSHLIYAGADIMLVPSRFEPCGLTQLIAMKYGAIPVVREVGGLADTVFDKDFSDKPLHERNGYIFRDYDHSGLESALGRALSCYYDYPDHFRELMKNAMRYDFSWKNPGQDYLNIYDFIREK